MVKHLYTQETITDLSVIVSFSFVLKTEQEFLRARLFTPYQQNIGWEEPLL